MKVGETIEEPIERAAIVRNYAYELSLLTAAKYTTAIDKERSVATITRVEWHNTQTRYRELIDSTLAKQPTAAWAAGTPKA